MQGPGRLNLLRWRLLIAAGLVAPGCHDGSTGPTALPTPAEAVSVSITLYDEYDNSIVHQCSIRDKDGIRKLYDYLTPYGRSSTADALARSAVIGRLDFLDSRGGTTRVEFVDAGKNALCFRVNNVGYMRGGDNYKNYLNDHIKLYQISSESIDEGVSLFRKLKEICGG